MMRTIAEIKIDMEASRKELGYVPSTLIDEILLHFQDPADVAFHYLLDKYKEKSMIGHEECARAVVDDDFTDGCPRCGDIR